MARVTVETVEHVLESERLYQRAIAGRMNKSDWIQWIRDTQRTMSIGQTNAIASRILAMVDCLKDYPTRFERIFGAAPPERLRDIAKVDEHQEDQDLLPPTDDGAPPPPLPPTPPPGLSPPAPAAERPAGHESHDETEEARQGRLEDAWRDRERE